MNLWSLTIGEAFEETVSRFPKRGRRLYQNIRYTYEQLEIE
jgi:hypothetical protein